MNEITIEDQDRIRSAAYNKRQYTTDVQVTLGDLLFAAENSSGDALLSELATGTTAMRETTARVVDWKDDDRSTLIIQVTGDVTDVLAAIEAARLVDA